MVQDFFHEQVCSPLRIDGLEDENTFWDGSFLGGYITLRKSISVEILMR